MNVLITGGAGFIGSHLVDYYLKQGDEVLVIDSLITGRRQNIKHHEGNKRLKFLKKDICETMDIAGRLDLILHFASPASPFDYLKYPIETLKTAAFGTYNLLEIARRKKVKIVIASTSEVYGDPDIHPQKEEYWGNVNPVGPRAVYDEGKRYAEAMTIAYHRKFGLDIGIIRIFNTYGERMRSGDGRVIPTFVTQALRNRPLPIFGNGKQTRSFCYIDDMVRGIVRMTKISHPMPINLGNPKEFTVLELAATVIDLTGSKSRYKFLPLPENDPKKRKPNITKAKQLLHWTPKTSLRQGLKKVIEWYQKHDD